MFGIFLFFFISREISDIFKISGQSEKFPHFFPKNLLAAKNFRLQNFFFNNIISLFFMNFFGNFFRKFFKTLFETFDHNVNVNNGVVFCVTGRRQKNCGRNWTSLSNIYGYVFKMTCRQAVASSSVYLDSSQNEVTCDSRFYLNLMCHQNSRI